MKYEKTGKKHWWIFLLACCIAAGVAVRVAFIARPLEKLVDYPLLDDSFYSLNIARNIALGRGMTHDRINPTNGFQPLFVFLAVPLYLIYPQDLVTPVQAVLLLVTFFSLFTGILLFKIGKLVKNERVGLFAALLWFLAPSIIKQDINGLETGVYAFFLMAAVYYYLSRIRSKSSPANKKFVVLGVLAGLTVLARIDALMLVAAAGLDFLVVSRQRFKNNPPLVLKQIGLFFLLMIITVAPWFLNNLIQFHSLMPVSGQAVRNLSLSPTASNYHAAGSHFPIDPIPPGYYWHNIKHAVIRLNRNPLVQTMLWIGLLMGLPALGYGLTAAMVLGMVWLSLRHRLAFEDYFAEGEVRGLFFTLVFAVLLIGSYVFYVFGQWYYERYFFPVQVLGLLYSGLVFDFSWEALVSSYGRKAGRIFASITVLLLVVTFGLRLKDRFYQSAPDASYYHYRSALWLNEKVSSGKTVGVFQSGAIGYFCRHRIINLDGVVNQKALQAMKEKRMFSYLKKENIDFVFDWPWMIDHYLVKSSQSGNTDLKEVGEFHGYRLYKIGQP